MGRVFSLEQVRNHVDHVPTLDDFEHGLGCLKSAVIAEIDRGFVSGAIVYGSAALRAYGIRSDIDCLITPHVHNAESMNAVQRILKNSNPTGRLDISAIVHPVARLQSGHHEIDRYFGDHLRGPSRIVYGKDPVEGMHFPDYGPDIHLLSYLRHKKRSVATSFVADDNEYYKGLQRILELPLAIGRKALRTLDEINGTAYATSDSANKLRITPLSLELFDSYGLGVLPRRVIECDRAYTQLLQDAIVNGVKKSEYLQSIQNIESVGIELSGWLDDFDDVLTSTEFRRV